MKQLLLGAAMLALTLGSARAETIGISMSLFDDNFLNVLRHNMEGYAGTLGAKNIHVAAAQADQRRPVRRERQVVEVGIVGGQLARCGAMK